MKRDSVYKDNARPLPMDSSSPLLLLSSPSLSRLSSCSQLRSGQSVLPLSLPAQMGSTASSGASAATASATVPTGATRTTAVSVKSQLLSECDPLFICRHLRRFSVIIPKSSDPEKQNKHMRKIKLLCCLSLQCLEENASHHGSSICALRDITTG